MPGNASIGDVPVTARTKEGAHVPLHRRTSMRLNSSRMILAGCALLLAAGPVGAAGPRIPVVESRDFARAAKAVQVGSSLRLQNLQVSDSGEPAALVLKRFDVFSPDAKLTLPGDQRPRRVAAPKDADARGA